MKSDETTKAELDFLVEYMKFHAMDYKKYQGTNIIVETSGDTGTAAKMSEDSDTDSKTIEDAEITAETSGATYTKTYGAMTYEEFEAFKFSLPIPNELREDYIFRINKLVTLRTCHDCTAKKDKTEILPEVLPLELFQHLIDCYPKDSKSNYDDYCKKMKEMKKIPVPKTTFDELVTKDSKIIYDDYLKKMKDMNNIPVSKTTFDELGKVSDLMKKNPFTFDEIQFYKIIATSSNQKSLPSWPWFVEKILKRREMKKIKLGTAT